MARHQSIKRRSVLKAAGSLALTSVLAGCMSDGDPWGNGTETENEPKSIESWLSETGTYHGTIEDMTGKKAVTVEVEPEPGVFAFAPAAVKIAPQTTVTWKWMENVSSGHDVVATDGQFDSGRPKGSGTFKHTFESPGKHYYYCDPHKSNGMKGVIVVADSA